MQTMKAVEEICLVAPTPEMEQEVTAFRQEFFDAGEQIINGSALLDKTPSYADWLARVQANARAETVQAGWVRSELYMAVRVSDRYPVGIIDLRCELNAFLRDFGHSGFSVRPSERRRGYGKRMLQLLCDRARALSMPSLQLAAEAENTPSLRIIEKLGRAYQRDFLYENRFARVYILPL